MSDPAPAEEPSDPAEWLLFATKRAADLEATGTHFGRTMAHNWRLEIENARLPHYFNRIRIESCIP